MRGGGGSRIRFRPLRLNFHQQGRVGGDRRMIRVADEVPVLRRRGVQAILAYVHVIVGSLLLTPLPHWENGRGTRAKNTRPDRGTSKPGGFLALHDTR